ncbi:hypothetical protein Tco_1155027 [Tanacetum coccineum]
MPNQGFDRGWSSGTDYRLRKLKMPLFNRDDVYDWVYQAERFFDIQGLFTTGERLRAAMMCLEGSALSWSRWSANKEPFRTWEKLKSRMLIHGSSIVGVTGGGSGGNFYQGAKAGSTGCCPYSKSSGSTTRAETGKTLFKRMTEAEMADKRAKRLYYRCDGTFGPGHRCSKKALQVLWVGEDEDEEEEGDSFFPP